MLCLSNFYFDKRRFTQTHVTFGSRIMSSACVLTSILGQFVLNMLILCFAGFTFDQDLTLPFSARFFSNQKCLKLHAWLSLRTKARMPTWVDPSRPHDLKVRHVVAECSRAGVWRFHVIVAGAATQEGGGERRAPEGEEGWSDVQEEECSGSSGGGHFSSSGKDSKLPSKLCSNSFK